MMNLLSVHSLEEAPSHCNEVRPIMSLRAHSASLRLNSAKQSPRNDRMREPAIRAGVLNSGYQDLPAKAAWFQGNPSSVKAYSMHKSKN